MGVKRHYVLSKAQDKHKKAEASQRGKAHWAEVVKIIKKSRARNQIALVRERTFKVRDNTLE